MNPCLICQAPTEFHFSKTFKRFDIGRVDYWRCVKCGFTISKTHAELSVEAWQKLNVQYHAWYQGTSANPDDPKWLDRIHAQAEILADLVGLGILKNQRWLDYACGDGVLSKTLRSGFGLQLLNYDRYMPPGVNYLKDEDLKTRAFDLVITTSVFEHITKRQDYDLIESLVSEAGTLGLHTLVRQEIPPDPEWFYLLPVHTSFFTNRSMEILFEQWGYRCSVYHVDSRLWLWFKAEPESLEASFEAANLRDSKPQYIFKRGFVDYWK